MKKVLIAGGTGFVGNFLIKHLANSGYAVNVLARNNDVSEIRNVQYFQWDIDRGFIDEKAFESVDKVINMTGAGIGDQYWTKKRKVEIIKSRTESIDLLYKYVSTLNTNIDTFISSSAIGYYGAVSSNEIFTETSAAGSDFLASVCERWEKAALQFERLGIATVILRKGVIVGKEGGMYQKLAPLAKLGINVSLGGGRQYLPWIDIRDLVRLYDFLLQKEGRNGVYNAVSSEHITMNDFSKVLLQSFGRTSFLPNAPAILVKLLFGEMAVMLLEGSKVSNEKLKKTGFQFEYDTIEKSLIAI